MPNLLGTAPNQVPTNGDLGKLAFMDVVDTVTNNPYVDTAISDTKPSLLLDFANSKTLDPRITYTRASTASYYDGKTTAVAEQNLALYSEQFDNAAWGATGTTIAVNTSTDPNGTTTADTLSATAGGTFHFTQQVVTAIAGVYTFSAFFKAGTSNFAAIRIATDTGVNRYGVVVNLSTGVITTTLIGGSPIGTSSSIVSVGNGWYRVVATATNTSGSVYTGVALSDSGTPTNSAGLPTFTAVGGESVLVWGAQLEQRSSVSSYTPTTSSPITNYIPALQTAAAGVPRFDHDPVTGESKGFLIEEQRTNLLTYSDQFNIWTLTSATIDANSIVAPDGSLTGDKYIINSTVSSGSSAVISPVISKSAVATTYTYSAFMKAGGFNSSRLYVRDNANSANVALAYFNLSTNSISGTTAAGTFTNASASMIDVGNGWYRCTLTFTSSTETLLSPRVYIYNNGSTPINGDGYSGLYIWGAQLEAGSFATSYIPTTSAQVTRSADAASMTGSNFSSWYNQAEGTLYGEVQSLLDTTTRWPFAVDDGTASNLIGSRLASSGMAFIVVSSSVNQASIASLVSTGFNKLNIAYKTNDVSVTNSGTAVVNDSSVTLPAVSQLTIGKVSGGAGMNGTIKKLAYYPKRLSDAEVQEMTL